MGKIMSDELLELFPNSRRITSEAIRSAVLEVWEELFRQSAWEDINGPGFVSACPDYSLVRHTNYVTDMALKIADLTEEHLGWEIDRDVLLASCLLHDVSKPMETEPDENGFHKSEKGKQFQHGFLAAFSAMQHGLPDAVISNLITHTGNSKIVPTNLEGIILYYVDMVDTDLHYFKVGKPLYIALQK